MHALRIASLVIGTIFLASFALTLGGVAITSAIRATPTAPEESGSFPEDPPYEMHQSSPPQAPTTPTPSATAVSQGSTEPRAAFVYSFNVPGTITEASGAAGSASPYWFLSSGGRVLIEEGIGTTLQGKLPATDRFRLAYARRNPTDTDNGYRPQNLLRLHTKDAWSDARVELSFKIEQDNLSASPNRNASNGVLLMSRHQDQDTLYYAGLRVDGTAVIKKKYRGTYYTMAQAAVFPGTYHRDSAPSLLPKGEWFRLALHTETNTDGSVALRLYRQTDDGGPWTLLVAAADTGSLGNTPPITEAGSLGVRTDFMDVLFKDFRVFAL